MRRQLLLHYYYVTPYFVFVAAIINWANILPPLRRHFRLLLRLLLSHTYCHGDGFAAYYACRHAIYHYAK